MPKSLFGNLAAALHLIVSLMKRPRVPGPLRPPKGSLVRRWWI